MGCGSSKLEAPSIIHSWLTQRGPDTIDRRGYSKDQLLSPLEVTSPTVVDPPSKSMSDDYHIKEGRDEVEEKEDLKISTKEEEEKDDGGNIVNEEDDEKSEDSIRHCGTSPSFRVYCLHNGNDDDEEGDKDKDGGSINSHPSKTSRMVFIQQELDNSSVGETSGRNEGKRSKGRKLIQKDMFKGAGKNLRHLKLPHRRSASTDSHYQVELNDSTEQPRSNSLQDHDQADESSHRQRRRHKLPLRLPHRNSTGSNHDTQSDDQSEDGNHRHRHLKLPHFARRGSSHEEGSNHSARDDTSSQDNQSECSERRRRRLKLPHHSRHGSGERDGNRRAQPQTNSHDDDQNECRSSCDSSNNSCPRITT